MDHQQSEITALRQLAQRLIAEIAQKDREITLLRGQLWAREVLASMREREAQHGCA